MKSGVIIYVAGNAPQDWAEENETGIRNLVSQADAIEIITSKTGHVDVFDAWRALLLKGMAHISCKMAIFSKSGEIELTGKETRLCG